MNSNKSLSIFLLSIFMLILSGCGGGGGGGGSPVSPNGGDPSLPLGDKGNPVLWDTSVSAVANNSISIDALGKYFLITNLPQGQDMKLNLTSSYPVQIKVYNYNDYTSLNCTSSTSCIVAGNANSEAYVEVEWYTLTGTDLNYSFSMNFTSTIFEGSITAPNDLTGLTPYTNTIPADMSGYYMVSGLTAGNQYTFRLVLPTGSDSDLFVYQDAFASMACSSTYTSNGTDEFCSFIAASDTAWVKVRANEGGAFDLTVTDDGIGRSYTAAGGIGTEVEVTVDATSLFTEVDYTASYYHVGGLDPSKQYRTVVSLNLYQDNIDLYVYGDNAYSNLLCSSTNLSTNVDEVCLNSPSASGELWIKVDGSNAHKELGAQFYLDVNTYYPNEGTGSAPLQLNYSAATPLHSGTVDTYSYYQINGLTAGQSYVVHINNMQNTMSDFFVDSSYASPLWPDCEIPLMDLSGPDAYCIAEANSTGNIFIKAVSSYTHIGAGFDISVSLSPYQSEGTVDTPVVRAFGSADLPYTASIGGSGSYYMVSGLTIDQAYTVSIDGTPPHPLKVYTSDPAVAGTGSWVCSDSYPDYGATIEECTVRTVSDTIWIVVDSTNLGGSFTLDVVYSPYQSEGSLATPIQIALGADEIAGVTRTSTVSIDASYYQLTGLTAGKTYAIAARNMNATYNHTLSVYDDVALFGSTNSADTVCHLLNISSNWSDKYCFVTPTGTSLWMMLEAGATSNGGSFDLSARLQPLSEIVALDYTVPMTFPRAASSVGETTNSSYTITGLLPNELYNVTLSNLTDDVDISCNQTQNTGLADELCVKAADGTGTLTVTVIRSNTLYGAYFTLGIAAGLTNEGTSASPVAIAYATQLPYSGQAGTGYSYYNVTGLLADTLYEVNLTNLTGGAVLRVYTANFASQQCSWSTVTSANQLCGGTSTATGELFIAVDSRALGINFVLNLTQGLGHEGAALAETVLAYGTIDLPHTGSVDLTNSYYEISGLSGATRYYVVLSGLDDGPILNVYPDNTYGIKECSDSLGNSLMVACVGQTKNGGTQSLFVKVDGSSTVTGTNYTLDVIPAPVNEGTAASPSVLDYATVNVTPYDGQVGAPSSGEAYSYYRMDNVTDATAYALSLVTHQDDVRFYVYTSAADLASDTYACLIFSSGAGKPQVCNVTSVGTSFWIKIGNLFNSSNYGTFFTLSITP